MVQTALISAATPSLSAVGSPLGGGTRACAVPMTYGGDLWSPTGSWVVHADGALIKMPLWRGVHKGNGKLILLPET